MAETTLYFDQAASSFPKAPGVGRAMGDYIEHTGINIGRGTYARAMEAGLTVLETRQQLKHLFHFPFGEKYVIFTPGATYGLNQILRGFLRPGDHAVVSSMEHNAVMRPLQALEGVTFSRIPADSRGMTRPEDLLPLLRPETRLVLVSHASNVSGSLFPLEETARLCRSRGIPLAVDAAQTAGYVPLDFEALGLSALCVPGHKGLLGPQGVGALLLAPDFARELVPLTAGGTGSASDQESQPPYLPDRLESGTLNLPGIFGLHRALTYVQEVGVEVLGAHARAMAQRFLRGIEGLPVTVAGPAEPENRVAVVSLDFPGMDNGEAAWELEESYGILTRCGLHCAPNAHKTLGTFPGGTVRFSFGHSTGEEETDRAALAVRMLIENHKERGGAHEG